MASYRFCRSDDWALLARAHEACVRPHAPDLPPCGVEQLKLAAREIGLWAGNCMVATEGGEPIGVLLAAKREAEALVWRLGVRPDRLRLGHARHMLTSLRDKLAILGPRRIVAEVPETALGALALLADRGYATEGEWLDFILRRRPAAAPAASDLVAPVTVEDLVASGVLDTAVPRAWERSILTLVARKHHLRGLAVAPGERIEAHVLWEDLGAQRRILDLGCIDRERAAVWLGLLVAHVAAGAAGDVRLYRTGPDGVPFAVIEALGFTREGPTVALVHRGLAPA